MRTELRLRKEALEWRAVEGEVIALDLKGSRYLAANRTAALLWPKLASGAAVEELVDDLTDAFGIDESVARRDVEAFIAALDERELIQR